MPNQGGSREKSGQQSRKNQDDNDRNRGKQQEAQEGKNKQQSGENRGGSGNFANDPERASEAGRKGGKS
jgi:general stress protein YciG